MFNEARKGNINTHSFFEKKPVALIMLYIRSFIFLCFLRNIVGNYDVIIVGAGPAGIGAAIELKKLQPDLSIKILEARDRIGGRVLSDNQTFQDGVIGDVGAQWIHAYGPKNPLYQWHRRLQRDTDKNGDHLVTISDPDVTGCFDMRRGSIIRQTCTKARRTTEKIYSPKYRPILDETDVSVKEYIWPDFMRLESGIVKRLVEAMLIAKEEDVATGLDKLSALQEFFRYAPGDTEEDNGEDMALVNGYGTLINRIAEANNLVVDLNSIVTHISTSDPNFVEIKTRDNQTFQSKAALITVPLGCLKADSITFEPELPRWKSNAIKKMGFGSSCKIILQFNRVFWNPKLTSFYIGGSPYPFVLCVPEKKILTFIVGGSRGRSIENTSDEITIKKVMCILREIFPQKNFELVASKISRWTKEEFTRGAFSYYALNTTTAEYDLLAQQCCGDRLFWAGEHTQPGGSVHNAFASGQRAAKKIIENFP